MQILIPAYQPDSRLIALVGALRDRLPASGILIIDDGSDESCDAVFREARHAGARIVRFNRNHGKGAALKEGFALIARKCPGEDVVTCDADGQHTSDDVARVALALRTARDDGTPAEDLPIVLGVRDFVGDVPARSRFGNRVSTAIFRTVSGVSVSDTQTGLRAYPASQLGWLARVGGDRYEFEFSALLAAARRGVAIEQVPIATVYLEANASSHFRPVRDGMRVYAPLLKFGASSLTGFVVDTALLLVLSSVLGSLVLAFVIARVISSVVNFLINRYWVFDAERRVPLVSSAVRYAALAAVVLALAVPLVNGLVLLGMAVLPAKIITDVTLFAVSYVAQRLVVFTSGRARRGPVQSGLPHWRHEHA